MASSTYKPILVTNFSGEKARQRFPNFRVRPQSNQEVADGLQPEIEYPDGQGPPSISQWRSNLTALSQRENLYFVAFEDKIHVTIPQGVKQCIPGKPDFILSLPVSDDATRVGGFIDPAKPHCVNQIKIGDFGNLEILLMACDDGDIIAFYVHDIMNCVTLALKTEGNHPDIVPFLHENIGASAWGLAIHAKSRVIAASCNLRQITVFIPGYHSDATKDKDCLSPMVYTPIGLTKGSPLLRLFNSKRVYALGPEGHNIPCLDFGDKPNGDVDCVLAKDISGNMWMFGLFDNHHHIIPGMHKDPNRGEGSMGWGLAVLPLKAFRIVPKPEDAIGGVIKLEDVLNVTSSAGRSMKVFDITSSTALAHLQEVSSLPTPYDPSYNVNVLAPEEDDYNNEEEDVWTEMEERMAERLSQILDRANREHLDGGHQPLEDLDVSPDMQTEFDAAMAAQRGNRGRLEFSAIDIENMVNMFPDDIRNIKTREALHQFLDRQFKKKKPLGEVNRGRSNSEADLFLPDGSAILRCYQTDIELIAPTLACPQTICTRLVRHDAAAMGPNGHRGFCRLNLVIPIPELSLVVIGSQAGRVALVSLTRAADGFSINGPVVSLHVDGYLPTRLHMHAMMWPRCPLLGLAASPVRVNDSENHVGSAGAAGNGDTVVKNVKKSWRLIMHYYDHAVLSYELSRDIGTNALSVL